MFSVLGDDVAVSLLAVMVTVPVLWVAKAGILKALVVTSVKSVVVAGLTGLTNTFNKLVGPPRTKFWDARIVVVPFSGMADGDSHRVTTGASASVMVNSASATGGGADGWAALDASPNTITIRSGAYQPGPLPRAATATVPVLATAPAGMVSAVLVDKVKSAALVGVAGRADTVMTVAAVEVRFCVAVTAATPFSDMDGDDSDKVTARELSSVTVSIWPLAGGSAAGPDS